MFRRFLLVFAFFGLLWVAPFIQGCSDSFLEVEDSGVKRVTPDGDWIPVNFSFEGIGLGSPLTRALSQEGENTFEAGHVRILVFDKDGRFSYEAPVVSVSPAPGDFKNKGTMVLFAKNTPAGNTSTFVMLVNVDGDNVPSASGFAGKTKAEVLAEFTFEMPANNAWTDGRLPMWGTSAPVVVNHSSGASPKLGTIHLIRAVARVDVGLGLSSTAQGASQFNETAAGVPGITLTKVFFYNTTASGRYSPYEEKQEVWDVTAMKAKAPSLPDPLPSVIGRIDKTSVIRDGKILLREFYLPECVNVPGNATWGANGETLPEGDAANYLKRPYIVVGLTGADKSNPARETFFRIDYLKRAGGEATAVYEYLPLLRNHRYLVNITNVGGPGFDTEDEAKQGPAANIMYNVVVWNESAMSDVLYDGQYMLGVSNDHFTFYREGGELSMKVQTSWPEGFSVKGLPSWITYSVTPAVPGNSQPTDEKNVVFNISETVEEDRTWPENPADANDILKAAYVQAGRMKWFLDFRQSKELKVSVQVFSDEDCTQPLDFIEINQYGENYGNPGKIVTVNGHQLTALEAGATVPFYVKVEPQNLEPVATPNVSTGIYLDMDEIGGGKWKCTAGATDITENQEYFDNYNVTFTFTVTHEATGKSASDQLAILQKEYNAIPFFDKELKRSLLEEDAGVYLMDGMEKKFHVKANTNFEIELLSAQADNGLESMIPDFPRFVSSHSPTPPSLSGSPVPFRPVDDLKNPRFYSGKAKFRISSPSGLFPAREFFVELVSAIVQPEANTYMIKKGAKQGILIPVSRINTAYYYYKTLLDHDATLTGINSNYTLPGDKSQFMLNKLDKDDNWSVHIVWTDMHLSGNSAAERSGLKRLQKQGHDYIYVQAGQHAGNVLIELRSNKLERRETLWSWHIWIVDEYPTLQTVQREGSSGAAEVKLMSHLIGAYENVHSNYDKSAYREFGMQYQWGRKDPFPSYGVYKKVPFYDGNGKRFDFLMYQKGDRDNRGTENSAAASGATLTMKGAVENPHVICSHQSFWNYECFPMGLVGYFKNRWVFLYPWNKPKGTDPSIVGGKTVFDPSPYGFRIMSKDEAITLRNAYYLGPSKANGLATPSAGTIYDGSLLNTDTGNKWCIFAVAQGRKNVHAGSYLLNSVGSFAGWTAPGSYENGTYRRAMTFSVRPVADPEAVEDYKKFLPH